VSRIYKQQPATFCTEVGKVIAVQETWRHVLICVIAGDIGAEGVPGWGKKTMLSHLGG